MIEKEKVTWFRWNYIEAETVSSLLDQKKETLLSRGRDATIRNSSERFLLPIRAILCGKKVQAENRRVDFYSNLWRNGLGIDEKGSIHPWKQYSSRVPLFWKWILYRSAGWSEGKRSGIWPLFHKAVYPWKCSKRRNLVNRPGVCNQGLPSDLVSGGTCKIQRAISGSGWEGKPTGGRFVKKYLYPAERGCLSGCPDL